MIEVIGALYEKATQKHGIRANQSMQAQGISTTKQTEEKKQRVNRIASHALFQKKKKKKTRKHGGSVLIKKKL